MDFWDERERKVEDFVESLRIRIEGEFKYVFEKIRVFIRGKKNLRKKRIKGYIVSVCIFIVGEKVGKEVL